MVQYDKLRYDTMHLKESDKLALPTVKAFCSLVVIFDSKNFLVQARDEGNTQRNSFIPKCESFSGD